MTIEAAEGTVTREPMERSFAQVPDDLITDTRLSHLAVRLWCRLDKYAGRDGNAFPGRKTLARDLGVSPAGIGRALMELTGSGWIVRKPRAGGGSWATILKNRPRIPKEAADPVSHVVRPHIASDTTPDHGRYTEGHPPKDTSSKDTREDSGGDESLVPPPTRKQRKSKEEEAPTNLQGPLYEAINDVLPAHLFRGINRSVLSGILATLPQRGWTASMLHLGIRAHDWTSADGAGAAVKWLRECIAPTPNPECQECKGHGFVNWGLYSGMGDAVSECGCAQEKRQYGVPGVDYAA